jgi:hypothetical protein
MSLTGANRGDGTDNAAQPAIQILPTSNFTAGAMAVLCVSSDNPASGNDINSVTDTLGNTWTKRQSPVIDPGAAAAGHQGAIFTTPQDGGTLTTSTLITIIWGANKTAKTWVLMEVVGSAGVPTYVTGNIGTGGTGTTSPTITTGSITSGDMVIAMLALEAGTTETITQDGDSTNGAWSAQQTREVGSTTSGSNIASQRKVVTATATQTYNPTLGIAGDLCLAWIQIHETVTESHSGTLAVSGGGTVTPVGKKAAALALAISGGGSTTLAALKQALLALSVSGGGTATLAGIHQAFSALAISGGGSFTFTYDSDNIEVHSGTLSVTGGGSVNLAASVNRAAILSIVGGGSAVLSGTKGAAFALALSGGGSVVLTPVAGRAVILSVIGGGGATIFSTTARISALSVSGGGAITLVITSSQGPTVILTVSGGGGLTITGLKNVRARVWRTVHRLGPSEVDDPLTHEEIFGTTPEKDWR